MPRWLIDSDVFIEGERGNPAFERWRRSEGEFATAEVVVAEFLFGVCAVKDPAKRARGETFFRERVRAVPALPNEAQDFERAARLAGEVWRTTQHQPSLVDALLAAIALRTGATVAMRNLKDFEAMGCPCADVLS